MEIVIYVMSKQTNLDLILSNLINTKQYYSLFFIWKLYVFLFHISIVPDWVNDFFEVKAAQEQSKKIQVFENYFDITVLY